MVKKNIPQDAPAPTLRQTLGLHSAGQKHKNRVKPKPEVGVDTALLKELKLYRKGLERRQQEATSTYQRCIKALAQDFSRPEGPSWEQTGDETKWRQAREEARTLADVIQNLDSIIAHHEET